MNRKNKYKDMEKYNKTKREQLSRYRERTGSFQYEKRIWTDHEDNLVMRHNIPDSELSIKIERSVSSISARRSRLKKIHGAYYDSIVDHLNYIDYK
jgi:hypothetical protein